MTTQTNFTWNPYSKTVVLLNAALEILDEFTPRSVRGIYYALITRGFDVKYPAVEDMILNARKAKMIPWSSIVDRHRGIVEYSSWEELSTFKPDAVASYRRQAWVDQDNYIEVWVEKDALIPILEQICDKYRITIRACRGFDSWGMIWDAVVRMNRRGAGKYITIIHLSDFDGAGYYMPEDLDNRFAFFEVPVTIDNIALTPEQAEPLAKNPDQKLKPAKGKSKTAILDNRFLAEFGPVAVEVDAIKPADLQSMVEAAILGYVDVDALNSVLAQESDDRAELVDLLGL